MIHSFEMFCVLSVLIMQIMPLNHGNIVAVFPLYEITVKVFLIFVSLSSTSF